MSLTSINKIASIIANQPLAVSLHRSITAALKANNVKIAGGKTVWKVFKASLDQAIRDIENHPRGKLFRRLIVFGPHNPDEPEALTSDDETVLSDPECGSAVNFIFHHMVNRFKGELAELLAIEPCIELFNTLKERGELPRTISLYWGELIKERRRIRAKDPPLLTHWGDFVKGADGLVLTERASSLEVLGVVEIKSMVLGQDVLLKQIETHVRRLDGGIMLGDKTFRSDEVQLNKSSLVRVMVVPSKWKLSREWLRVKTENGSKLEFPVPIEPPGKTQTELLESRTWRITLSWSEEALEQAAYTMTFWYMAQVGKHVYAKKELPKGWEDMSNEEAGMNAVKQMLYFLPLRYLTSRQEKRAIWLYNIYGFGYVAGVDAEEMLWPEDFASYKIDEEVVQRLASASVPENIVQKLKSLMPIQMTGEMNFRECLKSVLSEEELKNNKSVILKSSEFFPESDWVG